MARAGLTSANYLKAAAAGVAAVPVTLSAWFNITALPGASGVLVELSASGSAFGANDFLMYLDSTGHLVGSIAAAVPSQLVSVGTVTLNAWHHGAVVFSSATAIKIILDGTIASAVTTSRVPVGVNTSCVGVSNNGGTPSRSLTGAIAEAAVWNAALVDADLTAIGKGLSPLRVHPEALVDYWPLIGRNSPENDLKSNARALTITGALTQAAHPRIIMPRRRALSAQ